jgi:hypothetical protein
MTNQYKSQPTPYTIFAQPVMLGDRSPRLDSILLTASRTGATDKPWATTCDQLIWDLSRIVGKATARELIACLRAGQDVNLSGTYTPYQLIQLGYRSKNDVRHHASMRTKSPANQP